MSAIVTQQPPTHGSVGPVIGVLAVVLILCVVAVIIGRMCSGRSIMGYGNYDMENWLESKCSSCVDGRILVFTPPVRSSGNDGHEGSSTPASIVEATPSSSTAKQQAEHENVGS